MIKLKDFQTKQYYTFLRDEENPIKEHSFNILELKSVEKVIEKTAKSIRDQEFSPKKGKHCDWCDYKNLLCPEWGD